MGFRCTKSEKESIQMQYQNALTDYEVFRTMEFNSDRKRMSVLLKDKLDG
jgi:magnesium-transporting ATPase (P-type)